MNRWLRLGLLFWLLIAVDDLAAQTEETGPAYLAYAGPYSSSPSSAFGHLFLVLPSSPDEAPPLWDVISFNAETYDAGFLRYLTIGIAGGFLGQYERLTFHEMTRDYGLLEDRDIWLIRLELTPEDRRAIDDALETAEDQWYPYTFFQKNCAYYLQVLLANATGRVRHPGGFVSPTGVFGEVLRSGLGGPTYMRPATSTRLKAASATLSEDARARLQRDGWTGVLSDSTWIASLEHFDRQFVQEFAAWKELSRDAPLDSRALAGRALVRALNAEQESEKVEGVLQRGPGATVEAPSFHGYTRLRTALSLPEGGAARIHLRLRGALHDDTDPVASHRPVNSMEFLAVEASVDTGGGGARVDELVIFAQRALAPSDWLANRRSWMIEVLGRRGGVLNRQAFHGELRGGLGKTVELRHELYAYGLITMAAVGTCCSGFAMAPGLEAGLVVRRFERWRASVSWLRERNAFDWGGAHQRVRGSLRHDVAAGWGINMLAQSDPSDRFFGLSVDWYP